MMSLSRFLLPALMAALVFWAASDTSTADSNSITTLSLFASDSSMVLDASGNPVIAYRDSLDTRLRILHCDDPFCSGGGESLVTPEVQSGAYPSIALDAAGNPVVSYYTTPFDRLKLLRCDDPDCAGGESITTPDPQAYLLNHSTSLAIDAAGNPVIAYAPWAPLTEIRIMHCNDPLCAGNDESITIHDSFADAPSLQLDAAGNPVVAYYRSGTQIFSTGTLRVMHCNDPDCSGGDETTTSPDPGTGITPALKLDAAGNPVIAYYTGASTRDLKVMHCNDANCAGSNESITTPDSTGSVGSQPSLALSGAHPVVTYRDEDNGDLKLLRCDDPDCALGNDTIVSLDAALDSGENSSVAVDGSGLPAIVYDAGPGLHLLRCSHPDCAELEPAPTPTITPTPTPKDPFGDTDGDTIPNSSDPNDDNDACTDVQELGSDETLGGRRNPHNPWDFYDVAGANLGPPDRQIDLFNDIVSVIDHYAPTGLEPEYDAFFDRGPTAGPNGWNMTAPDGKIDLFNDIVGVINQFGHDCR